MRSSADAAEVSAQAQGLLRFQLGNGVFHGRAVLDPALMKEMRTVPPPDAGAPAGYALGVARTRWWAGQNLDLLGHGGGGDGFLSDLWWLPRLGLGIALLTNSETHDLQVGLALGILRDLITDPDTVYHDHMLRLPALPEVAEPDSKFVAPAALTARIAALAMPRSQHQSARWAGYPELYRTGELGAMIPGDPPSRFHVESGVPFFDASEDGTPVPHQLTEFRPGLFLADNGETLDLRRPVLRWRGLELHPVTNGPVFGQWVLLVAVVVVAGGWFVLTVASRIGRRRRSAPGPTAGTTTGARVGRQVTTAVAAVAALAALAAVAAIRVLPALVDVGFLGRVPFPFAVRIAFHLPLAVAALAAGLAALLVAGALRRRWTPRIRPRDAVLADALIALAAQLASWNLVAWGF